MAEAKPFRIALTSAGAVSGGPYSAGVIDFIIEALDAWYDAKKRGEAVPSHDVRIDAVSGTSAGAVAAGLFPAAVIRSRKPSSGRIPPLLKEVWVDSLDLLYDDDTSRGFLGLSDMQDPGDAIPSLLNSHRLDAIAEKAFGSPWDGTFVFPQWLSTALHIIVCITNIPGIPYRVPMQGTNPDAGHDMYMHADHRDFLFAPSDAVLNTLLTPIDPHGPTGWSSLTNWVLASAAFPVGLAPRVLVSTKDIYEAREWAAYGPDGCEPITIPTLLATNEFQFPAVDGGIINNEPFELARQVLLDGICDRLPREGNKAHSAVVLIDPFPTPFEAESHNQLRNLRADIVDMALPILSAMKQQCRFKPVDLMLAARESIYSRYLVAPSDGGADGGIYGDNALAAAGLGAFSGFLWHAYREHDYQLGRRNAQQFLRCHFALPLDNWLFTPDRDRYKPGGDLSGLIARCRETDPSDHVPIIPLLGALANPIPRPQWPTMPADKLDGIGKALAPRLNTIVSRLGRKTCRLGRFLACVAWPLARGKIIRMIIARMVRDLSARNQLTS